jgi:hypothetical protein
MPVHVEEMTSEVTVVAGELPLTEAQVEKLVQIVFRRLAEKHLDADRVKAATKLRRQSTSPFDTGE